MGQEKSAQTRRLDGIRVVMTGARGFIGSQVLPDLLSRGAQVTVLLRTKHGAAALRGLGARVVIAPLKPSQALYAALLGQDVLVNLAYDFRASQADNMASFQALIAASEKGGIRRIVHASSAVVYDDWPKGRLSEVSPVSTVSGGAYRQAKIAMENKLLESDFEVIILQPTIVYGPQSPQWTQAQMAALKQGGVVLPDPSGNCAAVHVKDVSQAIVSAVFNQFTSKERYLITGPDSPNWLDFYQGYVDILGEGKILTQPVDALLRRLPEQGEIQQQSGPSVAARLSANLRLILGSRSFDRLVAKLRGLKADNTPTYPDAHMLALLMASPEISCEKARRELGYEPVFDFARGLKDIRQHMG